MHTHNDLLHQIPGQSLQRFPEPVCLTGLSCQFRSHTLRHARGHTAHGLAPHAPYPTSPASWITFLSLSLSVQHKQFELLWRSGQNVICLPSCPHLNSQKYVLSKALPQGGAALPRVEGGDPMGFFPSTHTSLNKLHEIPLCLVSWDVTCYCTR